MEIRADGYKNSVATVAIELMGPEYIDRRSCTPRKLKFSDYEWESTYQPWVDKYLPLLRTGLDPEHLSGRDEVSFSHKALAAVTPHINRGIQYAAEGVSWTVALAILNNEPALAVEGIQPVYLRYLFDLALGVAVEDLQKRHEGAKRNYAYGVVKVQNGEDWARIWQSRANRYSSFQEMLRANISTKA